MTMQIQNIQELIKAATHNIIFENLAGHTEMLKQLIQRYSNIIANDNTDSSKKAVYLLGINTIYRVPEIGIIFTKNRKETDRKDFYKYLRLLTAANGSELAAYLSEINTNIAQENRYHLLLDFLEPLRIISQSQLKNPEQDPIFVQPKSIVESQFRIPGQNSIFAKLEIQGSRAIFNHQQLDRIQLPKL